MLFDLSHLKGQDLALTGAAVAAAGGYILNLSRNLISSTWNRVVNLFICSAEIRSENVLFLAVLTWLHYLPQSRRFRNMHATTDSTVILGEAYSEKNGCIPPTASVLFSLGSGSHILVWRGKLVRVNRTRDSAPSQDKSVKETLIIEMLTRNPQYLRDLVSELTELSRFKESTGVLVHNHCGVSGYGWGCNARTPRPLDSVILPENTAEHFVADLRKFQENEAFYGRIGVPYRRGYLLEGIPGAGKSSLILAAASELKIGIWMISLASMQSDAVLNQVIRSALKGDMLVLEDVDCLFTGRERTGSGSLTEGSVTFSGLLNALDGLATKDGLIVVMTTNHREKLDPALIRPGRVDMEIPFRHATEEQAQRLFYRFFPDALKVETEAFARWATEAPRSMAQLQQALLERIENAQEVEAL